MRKIRKSSIPEELSHYVSSHPIADPDHSWKKFSESCSYGRRAVRQAIWTDQRGLCGYCEIEMGNVQIPPGDGDGSAYPDFQVEHFHPKSEGDAGAGSRKWELDWNNLIGACKGGDDRNLSAIDGHFSPDGKKDYHCGTRKRNRVLDDRILNPLTDVPAFPCLWRTDETRERQILLQPDEKICTGISDPFFQKARNTIEDLNLNSPLLTRARYSVVRVVEGRIAKLQAGNLPFEQAVAQTMREVFNPSAPTWPPFFSTIRARYGRVAEDVLHEIEYDG